MKVSTLFNAVILCSVLCFLPGCAMMMKGNSSFKQLSDTSNLRWHNIEVRDNLKYEDAWKLMVDTVAQKFDIEVVSQENAYLRTAWDHKWTGEFTEFYAVRATIKFSPDRKQLQIKSEATFNNQVGEDERFTQTLKNDLMGKIGRVTQ